MQHTNASRLTLRKTQACSSKYGLQDRTRSTLPRVTSGQINQKAETVMARIETIQWITLNAEGQQRKLPQQSPQASSEKCRNPSVNMMMMVIMIDTQYQASRVPMGLSQPSLRCSKI
mmetsp:Transcript_88869/g.176743  ORF Transcript_88869/g.176743 Transcript_88869/m.176743 type:complete len:117 (-) Transcript_88869:287-637(-)